MAPSRTMRPGSTLRSRPELRVAIAQDREQPRPETPLGSKLIPRRHACITVCWTKSSTHEGSRHTDIFRTHAGAVVSSQQRETALRRIKLLSNDRGCSLVGLADRPQLSRALAASLR